MGMIKSLKLRKVAGKVQYHHMVVFRIRVILLITVKTILNRLAYCDILYVALLTVMDFY